MKTKKYTLTHEEHLKIAKNINAAYQTAFKFLNPEPDINKKGILKSTYKKLYPVIKYLNEARCALDNSYCREMSQSKFDEKHSIYYGNSRIYPRGIKKRS